MAADGKIVIDVILADGTVAKGVANINKQIDGIDKSAKNASTGVKDMVTALGLVGLAQKGIQLVTSALDGAIKRFDTINGFPSVMERMGFSSEAAQKSINKLSEGIQGLPTTLDGIVGSTQNIAILTGDLDTATDTALSLNNAFLASGTSAADAERGLVQYVQMLSKGSVDMQSWRTLQETMGYAVNKTAEAFGFAGESAQNDLYKALKDGDIKFKDFNAKIIELNGGVNGFADIAKNSSAGISTSFGNLKNVIVVGIANMIFSFDQLAKEVTGKSIAENLDSLKIVVRNAFAAINSAIESAAPIVKVFASAISATIPVVQALTPAIIGLTAAFAAYTIYTKASVAIEAAKKAIAAAEATTQALTIATNARVASQIVMNTTDRAGTAITVASTSAITLKTAVIGVLTGAIKLSTVAQIAATAATTAWGVAIKFLMGPIGWITAGIGLLVTGVVTLVKWFNRTTEEGAKLAEQNAAVAESTKALSTSVEESAVAYQKNQQNIATNAQAYIELAAEIEALAAKEKKTAGEKKLLQEHLAELNKNVDGLNLAYGEQTNALSMTSEQILNRINLMKEEEKFHSAQERLTEIIKEQNEIQMQLDEITKLREEWKQALADGTVTTKEHKTAIEELDEKERTLSEAHTAAGEERKRVDNELIESSAAVAEATEQDIGRQLKMFEELSTEQQEAVKDMKSAWDDYESAATDMFDTLSDKSKTSVAEMQKNLEENQRIISEWSENIAKLAERGIDEGLLNTLREAGPESAGYVNALVQASDTELQKLSETFSKGGEVATQALSTSLGIENTGLLEAVGHLVIGTEQALSDSIKSADWAGLGVDIAKGQAQGIKDGTPEAEKAASEMAKATEDATRKMLRTNSPSKVFIEIGKDTTDGLALGIKKGIQAVLKSITTLMKNITKPFDNISATFEKVGNEAMAGMVRGLKAGEKQVIATARSIANSAAQTVRQALDIHSPSRVFKQIGAWISEGWAIGIEETGDRVVDAVSDIALNVKDIAEHYVKEEKKLRNEANSEIAKIEKSKATEIEKIEKRMHEDVAKAQRASANKKKKTTQDDALKIQRIREDAANKIAKLEETSASKIEKIRTSSTKKIVELESKMNKDLLDETKRYIDDRKSLDQLSLIDEAKIWEESVKLFAEGSKERVKAQQEHKKAVDAVNKEILSINNYYVSEMDKIDKEYVASAEKINKEYEDTFNNRVKSLMSFAGTFDEFKVNLELTGKELMTNLESQVDGFKRWQDEFEKLSSRGIDSDLLQELSDLGVKALPELVALNNMTDTELTKYSNLYREKSTLAREQATKELETLKKDTDNRLVELRTATDTQLSKLQNEWDTKIKNLVRATDTELSTLQQVGVNAGQGLLNGLSSMEGPLIDKARSIAEAIKATIEAALDIHSPSRWMRDYVAGNIAKGFDVGVDKHKGIITKASGRLGEMIKPDVVNKLRGVKANLGALGASLQSVANTTNTTTYDNSRKMYNTIAMQQTDDNRADIERLFRRLEFEFS